MLKYFTKGELMLWIGSVAVIFVSFFGFGGDGYLSLAASILGVTSLIFNAKGNPIGPLTMIIFSLMYGAISYECAYYGEMATYIGMTLPMSVFALVSWLQNPYKGNRAQVTVSRLRDKQWALMVLLTIVVTVAFYFILEALNTANLIWSTVSVTTSFMAAYLTFLRSPYYALAYAANDVVLIVLWSIMSMVDRSYLSVLVCFVVFLVNDLYGFYNWKKMEKVQKTGT